MAKEVETVNVTIAVGKETKDVADVLAELVLDIKAGKKVEALTENLGGIMEAVKGYEMLGPEQKHSSRHATRAYLGMKLSESLDVDKVEETPAE